MIKELLDDQSSFRRDPLTYSDLETAVLILKPGFEPEHVRKVDKFIRDNKLKALYQTDLKFDSKSIVALYNDIFRFNTNDNLFGYEWKKRKLKYMTCGPSRIYIVRGRGVLALSEAFKYEIRSAYGKLSVPDKMLNLDEFEELAIKNLIHVVDSDETEIALWLLSLD